MKKILFTGLFSALLMFNGCAEKNLTKKETLIYGTSSESFMPIDEETGTKRKEPFLPNCPERGHIMGMKFNQENQKSTEEIKGCIKNVKEGKLVFIFTDVKITKIENE